MPAKTLVVSKCRVTKAIALTSSAIDIKNFATLSALERGRREACGYSTDLIAVVRFGFRIADVPFLGMSES